MNITVTLSYGVEVPAADLHDASVQVRADIQREAVGSNAWCPTAGQVKVDGVVVAHISYNGRAWLGADRTAWSTEIGEAEFQAMFGGQA